MLYQTQKQAMNGYKELKDNPRVFNVSLVFFVHVLISFLLPLWSRLWSFLFCILLYLPHFVHNFLLCLTLKWWHICSLNYLSNFSNIHNITMSLKQYTSHIIDLWLFYWLKSVWQCMSLSNIQVYEILQRTYVICFGLVFRTL